MAKDKPQKQKATSKHESGAGKQPDAGAAASSSAGIWHDERFQHLVSDPRFRSIPKVQRKVKIDKRFQSMFTDDKFKVKYTVDKYGRRVNKSNAEDLRKYYELNSSDTESDEEPAQVVHKKEKSIDIDEDDDDDEEAQEALERRKEEKAISRAADESGGSVVSDAEPGDNDSLASDGENVPKTLRDRLLDPDIDYARGEGRLITDSSSDDESSEDEQDVEMYIDHVWGELDVDAGTTEESTHRLAVCNMDWDRIRAMDLMVLFSSFLPPGGSILSVNIYPSDFGKERMREEEVHGPTELVGLGQEMQKQQSKKESDDSDDELVQAQDSDAEEGDDYHMEKLRQYQLNRLRYFYAVVECDSVQTADKIYKECDGIEYESSATRVDLRFIPNDTSFDEDEPSDVCTELPDTNSYKPRQFTTTALQQAKVDLTWDETAVERRELGEKLATGKLDEVSDKDLRKIVAYSSEEESDDSEENDGSGNENDSVVEKPEAVAQVETAANTKKNKSKKGNMINKYKALLAEINEKEKQKKHNKVEMEFSWTVEQSDEKDKDDRDLDEESKSKQQQQQLTPIQKELQKRNEKNRKRKEDRKLKKLQAQGLNADDASSDSDSIPDGIDMNDPYFAEEFANGDYVDNKSKKREKQKKEQKLRGRQQVEEDEEKQAKELQLLLDDDDLEEQGKQHFSLEKILKSEQETKSKRKRRKQLKKSKSTVADHTKEVEDNFQLNMNDERFKAIYTSPKFNIDPTHSHFKKTKGMEKMIQEKLKRRYGSDLSGRGDSAAREVEVEAKRPKKQVENTLLIKSLKRKIQMQRTQ